MKPRPNALNLALSSSLIVALLTVGRPAQAIIDVPYTFDATKVASSADAFHFLRSFVPYFYVEFKANRASLPVLTSLTDVGGWCAGDAHPENFGALLQENGKSIFTVNDMDDAGPCPVVLDLARLMASSRLYNDSIDLSDLMQAYRHGLDNKSEKMPDEIDKMLKDSEKAGVEPKGSSVDHKKLARDSQSVEVSSQIANQISATIEGVLPHHSKVIDIIETSKIGGGSGGLRRYEILVDEKHGLIQLELKQEVVPSIYPVATSVIPDISVRLQKTLMFEQGSGASSYYATFKVDGLSMILRPRFAGNMGISLDDSKKKENVDIINYEAYVLGRMHALSIQDPAGFSDRLKAIDPAQLAGEINQIDGLFQQKFKSLKR